MAPAPNGSVGPNRTSSERLTIGAHRSPRRCVCESVVDLLSCRGCIPLKTESIRHNSLPLYNNGRHAFTRLPRIFQIFQPDWLGAVHACMTRRFLPERELALGG